LADRVLRCTVPSRVWTYNPHIGGVKIPAAVRERTERRIRAYASAHLAGKFTRLDIRFRGALCYIDAYTEPEKPSAALLHALGETREKYLGRLRATPVHLCRLRYFGRDDVWSMAFFTYSSERYPPCSFGDGSWTGTPEQALEISSVYLQ
jgi:hypothetical protein